MLQVTGQQVAQGFVAVALDESAEGRWRERGDDRDDGEYDEQLEQGEALPLIWPHGACPFARMMDAVLAGVFSNSEAKPVKADAGSS
jgi:hypothetical protein